MEYKVGDIVVLENNDNIADSWRGVTAVVIAIEKSGTHWLKQIDNQIKGCIQNTELFKKKTRQLEIDFD